MSAETGACGPIDLVFLQDLSGSYMDDLPILKAQVPNLIADLNGAGADADFAVASFIDKPVGGFGSAGDYVYQTHLAVSADDAAVIAAVTALGTRSGADAPEAQLEALLQTALRDAELGYRAAATRVVMLSTDATFHVAGDFASQPANNLDAVLDGTPPGTGEDYPTLDGLRAALVAAAIFPVFSVTADVRADYEGLVASLGFGAVVTLTSDSVNFSDAVRTALAAACGGITHPGTDGNDDIEGTEGDDGCYGGLGDDTIHALGGDDVLDGGGDDDELHGGLGRDALRGGSGNDDLYGEEDDDVLTGGLGADRMTGGAGADRFAIHAGDGTDEIEDFENGIDRLDLSTMDKLVAATAVIGAVAVPGGVKVTFPDGSSVTLLGVARGDFDLADVILDAADAAPVAHDDAGATLGTHPVNLDVLANDFDVEGDPLSIVAVGAAGHGAATLEADGTVTYVAEAGFVGTDSFDYLVSDGTLTASATVRVTVARDTTGTPGDDHLVGDDSAETFAGLGGNDVIDAQGGDDAVDAGDGDDSVLGGWGRDSIAGGAGDDAIVGGPASTPEHPDDDAISGGAGNDSVDGGDGDDVIAGDAGRDELHGGAADDRIDGGDDDDLADGGEGDDRLRGGKGDDTLVGGAGDDEMDGGRGNDLYLIGAGDGHDVIEEDAAPAGSVDVVRFAEGIGFEDLIFSEIGGDMTLTIAGGGSLTLAGQVEGDPAKQVERLEFADGGVFDLLTGIYTPGGGGATEGDDSLTGTEGADVIDALGGNDVVDALGGDDRVRGGAGADRIRTGAGDDLVRGGAGGDVLRGMDGNDRLLGQGGADVLDGGAGRDRLTGGGGHDRFVFAPGGGRDVATDFTPGVDRLDFSALGLAADDLVFRQVGGGHDLLIKAGAAEALLLGLSEADLHLAHDLVF